ncbi:hypothetical protein BGX26_007418, partial [Mortierella sp. AD094]
MAANLSTLEFTARWHKSKTGEQLLELFESNAKLDVSAKGFAETSKFVKDLKELLAWLDKCHKEEHDPAFTSWLINELKTTKGVMHLGFRPAFTSDVTVKAESLHRISGNGWLNDEDIWRIYQYFAASYEDQVLQRPVMIPYDHLSNWMMNADNPRYSNEQYPYDWGKGIFTGRKGEKVFAVVYMDQHWGTACVDFENHRVYFGDSLNWCFPDNARKAIARWLVHLGMDLKHWRREVLRLNVPRQNDSSSCGVVACNTIDRALNEKSTPWCTKTAVCHRLRLMRLLTGYTKT